MLAASASDPVSSSAAAGSKRRKRGGGASWARDAAVVDDKIGQAGAMTRDSSKSLKHRWRRLPRIASSF